LLHSWAERDKAKYSGLNVSRQETNAWICFCSAIWKNKTFFWEASCTRLSTPYTSIPKCSTFSFIKLYYDLFWWSYGFFFILILSSCSWCPYMYCSLQDYCKTRNLRRFNLHHQVSFTPKRRQRP
jgi:hypothetical protein